ncbi:MAG: LacI family DNA-binding transcriptional regulator [Lachnospiraceae bacterium]|nr:LacI family DNA-binding transcriptional regulator [Lachnospiraceae bacterium]
MAKKVRMMDIAKKIDVSVVTVSKALTGQKGVSEEVRNKIIRLAEEMGYEKPGESRGPSKSYNIGVVVPEGYITKYETFYWELYQAINTSAARENSFVMLEIISSADENEGNPPKLLRESKVDALIVMGAMKTAYLKMIRAHYATPTVFLDFYDSEIQEDSVISNSFYGAYAITNYLLAKGLKKIAYVGTPMSTESITDRYLGYLKALMEKGIEIRKDWVIDDRNMDRVMYNELKLPAEMPEAFVCNCDMTASKIIEALSQKGISVPGDVAVTGFDDFLHPGLCIIPLTTYAVNMEGLADSAVRNILKKLNGIETNKGIHLIEGRLITRDSA